MSLLENITEILTQSGLSLIRARNASLVHVDDVNLNFLISFVYKNQKLPGMAVFCPPRQSTIRKDERDLGHTQKPSRTLALNVPSNQSDPPTEKGTPVVLPFATGVYLQFNEHDWWESAPPYVDISDNFRIVTIPSNCASFPSLEQENRVISIKTTEKNMEIRREWDCMNFSLSHEEKTRRRLFQCNTDRSTWTLRRVAPGQPRKLVFNSNYYILEYRQSAMECMLCLTNHHRARGDETYLILHRGETT